MNSRLKIFLFLLMGYTCAIQAQIDLDSIFEPKLCGEVFVAKTSYIGKQFYNDEWATGRIKLITGEWVTNKQLKYNVLLDDLIWLQDSVRQIKLEKHFIDEFDFKNSNGKFVQFERIMAKLLPYSDSVEVFAEVLFKKDIILYAFRSTEVGGSVNKTINGLNYSFERLIPQNIYILNIPGKKSLIIRKIKKRIVLKELPEEYKTLVIEAIHRNMITLRNENDLIEMAGIISQQH